MDYEKAYKKLVAKVKNAHLFAQTDSTKNTLEEILPELAESEDERIRKYLLDLFSLPATREYMHTKHIGTIPDFDSIFTWLEKQKPAEWSDEDDAKWYGVIETEEYMLRVVRGEQRFDVGNKEIERQCEEELDWLKSLRPQPHWKPSEDEITAIEVAVKYLLAHTPDEQLRKNVISVFEHLKQL